MQKSFEAQAGKVDLEGTTEFHNPAFGYTLFEEVVDPENHDGPSAIAMHVPAHSLSKVWQLVEPGYSERIELLKGSASFVVYRADQEEWVTMPLGSDNPTADDAEIKCGDMFCIVTDDDEAVVLSRPSKPFDISYENGVTSRPDSLLSRFVVAHAAAKE